MIVNPWPDAMLSTQHHMGPCEMNDKMNTKWMIGLYEMKTLGQIFLDF